MNEKAPRAAPAIADRLQSIQRTIAAPGPYDRWLTAVREVLSLLPEIIEHLENKPARQGQLPPNAKT